MRPRLVAVVGAWGDWGEERPGGVCLRQGRVGREIFPWVLALMIGIFVAEHFVANFFYDTETTAAKDITGGKTITPEKPAA